MKFMLCKKGGTPSEVSKWITETINLTTIDGFNYPKILQANDGCDVTCLCYECSDEQFDKLIKSSNLTVDQIVDGIRFLKSS